jgi:hypothetical protein
MFVDQHMTHLGLRFIGLGHQPGMDYQYIEGFGRNGGKNPHLFERLHRHDPVITQPVEHFLDVQALQMLFIGNQDGQCFVRHGKPLAGSARQ